MKHIKKCFSIALIGLFSTAHGNESPEGLTAAQVFLQVCATTYGRTAEIEGVVKSFDLKELELSVAEEYLNGRPGKAWRGEIGGDLYAVASEPSGLCSLFAHSGEPDQIAAAIESWLPPEAVGIVVSKEYLSGPSNLETISYELRGGKVSERWVVTVSKESSSNVKAILSWSRL